MHPAEKIGGPNFDCVGASIQAAVQIGLPITGAIMIIDIAMGMLVKAAPQMNVFVVGMPIKLLAGLTLLYMLTPLLSNAYNTIFDLAYSALAGVMKGMAG